MKQILLSYYQPSENPSSVHSFLSETMVEALLESSGHICSKYRRADDHSMLKITVCISLLHSQAMAIPANSESSQISDKINLAEVV